MRDSHEIEADRFRRTCVERREHARLAICVDYRRLLKSRIARELRHVLRALWISTILGCDRNLCNPILQPLHRLIMKIRSSLILLLSIGVAPLILSQQKPQSLADAELPSLLGMYKDIHAHPELSGQEERTAALVAKELRAAGCEITEHLGKYENSKLRGYGVVGVIKNGDGPTVLVRTDMTRLRFLSVTSRQ